MSDLQAIIGNGVIDAGRGVLEAGANLGQLAELRSDVQWGPQHQGRPLSFTSTETFGRKPQAFISPNAMLSYSPIFSGISMISGDVSGMPLQVKEIIDDDGSTRDAVDHPAHNVLLKRFGPREFTSNLCIEALIARAIFYGIGGARIYRNPANGYRISHMKLIRTPLVPVEWPGPNRQHRWYEYTDEWGVFHQVNPEDMFIVMGPSIDAFTGMGLYEYAARTVTRALAAEGYITDLFDGDAIPKGFFIHKGKLNQEARDRWKKEMEDFTSRHFGLLEEGVEWQATGVSPLDAALVGMLDMTATDVARFLKISTSKLGVRSGSGSDAPAKTAEESGKEYLQTCLDFWALRIQREADDKCFREDEKTRMYTCFDTSRFEERSATMKERSDAQKSDVVTGIITRDEARRRRNMNPLRDGAGEKPLAPLNMTTNQDNLDVTIVPNAQKTPASGEEGKSDDRIPERRKQAAADLPPLQLQRDVLLERLYAMANRVSNAATKAARKPSEYLEAINQIGDVHRSVVTDAIRPAVTLLAHSMKRSAAPTVTATVDDLFSRANDIFVEASECAADELPTKVSAASAAMRTAVEEIANKLCEV